LIVPHYDLQSPVECVLFQRGVNDTYLLSSHGRKFAVRVSRANWRSKEELIGELDALRHLARKGVRVVMPIARTDGDLTTEVQVPEGLRRAVMFDWITGRAPKYTDVAHAYEYGKQVATLHSASDDLAADIARPTIDLEYLLREPLDRIQGRLNGLPTVRRHLDSLVGRVLTRLNGAKLHLLDWGFCHGDVWSNNAHIDGSRVVLFDFDSCGWGWRLFDLASYRWEARRQNAEISAWTPFAQGYLENRPAAADSLRHVGLFMILRHLWTTGQWIILSTEMGVSFLPDEFFEDLVPFCERIEADAALG
jgi:Ser/Thr protein kinase RdoA (MazF antagonist)